MSLLVVVALAPSFPFLSKQRKNTKQTNSGVALCSFLVFVYRFFVSYWCEMWWSFLWKPTQPLSLEVFVCRLTNHAHTHLSLCLSPVRAPGDSLVSFPLRGSGPFPLSLPLSPSRPICSPTPIPGAVRAEPFSLSLFLMKKCVSLSMGVSQSLACCTKTRVL